VGEVDWFTALGRGDTAAFAEAVRRYGPLTLGACQRVLGFTPDADDAFQLTFLALFRKASAIRTLAALPGWLHRTAVRNAARLKTRRRPAATAPERTACPDPAADLSWAEARSALDEELNLLPADLRGPLVLCYLDGRTRESAAKTLGVSLSTLQRRLAEGLEALNRRLRSRGIVGVGLVAAVLSGHGLTAAVSAALAERVLAAIAVPVGGIPAPAWNWGLSAVVLAGGLVAGAFFFLQPAPVKAPPPKDEQAHNSAADALPDGAVARLAASPYRVGNAALALSADGGEVIAVTAQGVALRFDSATGKPLGRRQFAPRDDVRPNGQAVPQLTADGRVAAIMESLDGDPFSNSGRLSVWDVPGEKLLFRRGGKADEPVGHFGLAPDGKTLAMVEHVGQRTVLMGYEVATGKGKEWGELEYHVYDVKFSADGHRLVVSQTSADPKAKEQYTLTCFDPAAGRKLWTVPRAGSQTEFAVSPSGRTVAMASPTQRAIELIETGDDKAAPTRREQVCGPGVAHPNCQLAFAPGGRTLVLDYFDYAVVWDVQKGEEVTRLDKPKTGVSGYWPQVGAFSADGKTAVTNHGLLRRFDLTTGKAVFDPPAADLLTGPVEHLTFTSDGKEVFASAWGREAGRWEVAGAKRTARVRSSDNASRQLVHTPDGLRAVAYRPESTPHTVAVLDPSTGEALRTVRWATDKEVGLNGLRAVALAADGRTLLVAHGDEPKANPVTRATTYDLVAGRRVGRVEVAGNLQFATSPFSPCGRWVVMGGKVFHVASGTELFTLSGGPGEGLHPGGKWYSGEVWFSADGRLLAGRLAGTPTSEDTLAVWELASGKVIARLPGARRTAQVAFSPDGRTVATVDGRGACLHDLLGVRKPVTYAAPDIACRAVERGAAAQTVAFSPDGTRLATGHEDGSVTVWAVPAADAPPAGKGDEWADLTAESPVVARAAVERWARDPDGVKRLVKRVKPDIPPADPLASALIARLDDRDFAEREKATKQLIVLGAKGERAVREALAGSPSAEATARLERVLAALPAAVQRLPLTGEDLRAVRAVEVLERGRTPEGRKLLQQWAEAGVGTRLGDEAAAAVGRWPSADK